jgi:hypothetical protein
MATENLREARRAKFAEFYTLYHDIEKEMNAYLDFNPKVFAGKTILLPCDDPEWSNFTKYFAQNFERFKLKKLISTSYAPSTRKNGIISQPTLFETNSPNFDKEKTTTRGKIFVLERDKNKDNHINVDDLEWNYLKGNGDFRSPEITKLRDESDIIITNPPFPLFRELLNWIDVAGKDFVLIGNLNALSYKETFLRIKDNKMWLGATNFNKGMYFKVPENFQYSSSYKFERELDGQKVSRVPGVCWFTTLDHGKRHEKLSLMKMDENIRFSKHKEIKEKGYPKYDNYDAIEVAFADAIPADFKGIMGVPITFLDKYSPEQFEVVGLAASAGYNEDIVGIPFKGKKDARPLIKGKNTYARIFIKHRKSEK